MPQSLITQGVQITVEVFYQQAQSLPLQNEFMFAYRITLQNLNPFSIQLLRRQWHIFDSSGEYREVEGEGVVGQQPVLTPGESYQYVSGCNLKTDMGKMWGHFSMVNLQSDRNFKVDIPAFDMVTPMKKN